MSRQLTAGVLGRRRRDKDDIFNGGMFNGLEYQVVTNPVTGRQWLDRNLGATRVATAITDSQAFGHLFQWGRLFDGHEVITSPTRTELSTGDVPGHGDFITTSAAPNDWRNPRNDNLWQGVDAINSVAPNGWRLPTLAEWVEEYGSWDNPHLEGAFEWLKLTGAGLRVTNGSIAGIGLAYMAASTISGTNVRFLRVRLSPGNILEGTVSRASGLSVRLIKDI